LVLARVDRQNPATYPSLALQRGICSRCLSEGHARVDCRYPIRCYACRHGGHTAINYLGGSSSLGSKKIRRSYCSLKWKGVPWAARDCHLGNGFGAWAEAEKPTSLQIFLRLGPFQSVLLAGTTPS